MIYRFQNCVVDTKRAELLRNGKLQSVEPQVFRLLVHLIEHRDVVVSKDDLFATVWNGRLVSDATLSSRVSAARKAIGDSGTQQAAIRTIPRRGYRFVAGLEAPQPDLPDKPWERQDEVRQTIRYCSAADGIRLAYSLAGSGPPIVKTMSWLNHLEFDWQSPVFGPLFQSLITEHQLLRYDSRGAGLSDRYVIDLHYDALFNDLETVIEASGLQRFALFGISQGAALAIDYAACYPDRVSHLVLWGGYARGRNRRGNEEDVAQAEAFKTLMRHGWGKQSSTFLRMFASMYLPEGSKEQIDWWTDLQRIAVSPENAVRLRETIDDIDVSDSLSRVTAPTLILHSQNDEVAPFAEARRMAARISNATIIPLNSANHLAQVQEPAWAQAVNEMRRFLGSQLT